MVSGKGGVGKTSLSASLAVALAAAGHSTLVVSTDPAHSLSDSLDQDVSGGKPVPVEGTDLPLWGLEIDPDAAKKEWSSAASKDGGAGIKNVLGGFGLGMLADQLSDLRLGELLDTPPPGLDEAVAIAKVVEIAQSEKYARFSRVVVDTAPTGHTLRLLGVPDFVDAALLKAANLRRKLASAGSALRSLFGAAEQQDEAVAAIEGLRASVRVAGDLFRDAGQTEFVIATVPTQLAVAESKRLLAALRADGVPCKRVVVNQVVGASDACDAFVAARVRDQERAMALLDGDAEVKKLPRATAPMLDLEVRGLPALRYFGDIVWGKGDFDETVAPTASAPPSSSSSTSAPSSSSTSASSSSSESASSTSASSSSSSSLKNKSSDAGRRYVMLGGKGGVGKTSLSASLAARYASRGLPTLVVSTDPAHSLSDSLDQDVSGGKPVRVVSPDASSTPLPLWGMEVDLGAARAELSAAAQRTDPTAGDGANAITKFLRTVGLGAFADQLADLKLGELLDTPPPGVDEAVAIAKVVQLVKSDEFAHFERIVFDTAPTGHTLRLLTLPDFLDGVLGKVVRLRQRLTEAADAVRGVFGGGKSAPDPAVVAAEELRARAAEARALFRDKNRTSFVVATIPTAMAAAESARLVRALQKEGVPVGGVVVNQVLGSGERAAFLERRRRDQARALASLRADHGSSSSGGGGGGGGASSSASASAASTLSSSWSTSANDGASSPSSPKRSDGLGDLQIIEAPIVDIEVRGVPALRYFAERSWKRDLAEMEAEVEGRVREGK